MIKYIKNISFILVFMIICYGIGTNVAHVISNYKTITYNFDSKEMKEIKEMKKAFETNKKRIDSLSAGKFTEDELSTIKSDLDISISMMNEMNLWKLEGKKKLNITDIYVLKEEIYSLPLLSITSLSKVKTNHGGDKLTESMITNSFTTLSSYTKEDFESLQHSYKGEVELNIKESITYLKYYMETVNSLSSWCLEEVEAHA